MDISDDDSLRMIMKKLADDRNILLPAEVIDYLLLHIRRELPPLIDALERIHRHSLATGRKISVRLAREACNPATELASEHIRCETNCQYNWKTAKNRLFFFAQKT